MKTRVIAAAVLLPLLLVVLLVLPKVFTAILFGAMASIAAYAAGAYVEAVLLMLLLDGQLKLLVNQIKL